MADLTTPREAKQLINLTQKPIAILVPDGKKKGKTREIVLSPEKPEDWLGKRLGEAMTMFIVDDNVISWADKIHRTTTDFVIALLSGTGPARETDDGAPISTCELLTLKGGHPVKFVA
ncbi:hypothetical protein IJH02_02740 [Candidatus Saccharibacteria bacterium]|nr:hypothetical protein [Candidatus Saccharibacteria bacterium]